jgi:hypothetical protein
MVYDFYHPLNASLSEVRLVTVLKGEGSNLIQCTLGTVSLNNEPQYEALSYVCGDSKITKSITVEGEDFQITTNLESALLHLRKPNGDRVLWIDAISIRQDDNSEKSQQIGQMHNVYSKASKVIAWLGEESDDSNLAFASLDAWSNGELHWFPSHEPAIQEQYIQGPNLSKPLHRCLKDHTGIGCGRCRNVSCRKTSNFVAE